MRIESEKLVLTSYSGEDFENYFCLQLEDPWYAHFKKTFGDDVRSVVQTSLDEANAENFSVFKKPVLEYCGNISLHKGPTTGNPEIGIALLKAHQNQGIGTAAISLFCRYCFEQRGITYLEVRIDPENKRSIHVFEKLGAQFVKKQADYIALYKRLYEMTGDPIPDDLDETMGSYHYSMKLPLNR